MLFVENRWKIIEVFGVLKVFQCLQNFLYFFGFNFLTNQEYHIKFSLFKQSCSYISEIRIRLKVFGKFLLLICLCYKSYYNHTPFSPPTHTHTHTYIYIKLHLKNIGYLNQIYDNVDINRDLKIQIKKIEWKTLLFVKISIIDKL